ncbi:MAG TPA: CT253 family lipoprotein [Rhabdochlamydiaceae bacterium]
MSRFTCAACAALALALSGCQREDQNAQTVYHIPMQARPQVALVPVIDTSKSAAYAWNLSDEFTSSIYSFLEQGPLSLDPMVQVRETVRMVKNASNPFGANFSWLKNAFGKEEFVVFLELVHHEEVLKRTDVQEIDPKTCPADLNMAMRVRVFDLRGEEPVVVLQEFVNGSHFIPRQFTQVNFHQVPWGEEGFNFSPLGLAHLDFAREISSRIEDYILLAVKRSYSFL